jgi:hypothetical protein
MKTHGKAASPKRTAHKRKGGNPLSPTYIAIKFMPQIKTVSRVKRRCFGLKLTVLLIVLLKCR